MLSLEPDKLAEEVRHAKAFRRLHTLRSREIIQRVVGNWYRTDHVITATPENTAFSYLTYMLPNTWYSDPSCRIEARRPQSHAQIADALESALKGWFAETTFTQEGQEVVRDMMMGYGVMQVGMEPRDFPGNRMQMDGPGQQQRGDVPPGALRPFAVRVAPEKLIMDPLCDSSTKARFLGHEYDEDLDQLQAESQGENPKWDPAMVEQLSVMSRDGDDTQNERALVNGEMAERNRVSLVDLWIPEHGVLITLASQNSAANFILRKITYWGPPEGPYEVFGFYSVPNDPYPLAPLQAVMEQLEEMWTHQRQASIDAADYKRFVLVEENNANLKNAIGKAQSGGIYPVHGLGDFKVVEVGGSPEGRLAHIATLRDRSDRTLGLSDAQRGRVQGKTATETDIVQGNVDTRTSFMRQRVQFSTKRVLSKVCWYFFYDDTIAMPVTSSDPFTGAITEGTFLGGIQPGQKGIEFIDFNLSIEPTSMPYTDDAQMQQNGMLLLQIAQEVGPLIMQYPQINWRFPVNKIGDAMNIKNVFDLLFSQQLIQQFMQVPQAFGYAPPGSVPLPPGVNPSMVNSGMGMPSGAPPTWGNLPPGAAGGMASGGGNGGSMPGLPPMGGGGGSRLAFAPRGGGVMGPMGAPMMAQQGGAARPGVRPQQAGQGRPAPMLSGNPRSQRKPMGGGGQPAMHTGNPRAAKKAKPAGNQQSFV